jgi:hypothetical protein
MLRPPHLPTIMTDVCPMSERCVIFKTPADLGPAVTGSSAGDRRRVAHRWRHPCKKFRSYNSQMPPPISHIHASLNHRSHPSHIAHESADMISFGFYRLVPVAECLVPTGLRTMARFCELNRHWPTIGWCPMKNRPILGRCPNDAKILWAMCNRPMLNGYRWSIVDRPKSDGQWTNKKAPRTSGFDHFISVFQTSNKARPSIDRASADVS